MQKQHDPVAVIQAVNRAANAGDIPGMVAFFHDKAVIKLDPPLPPPFENEYRGRPHIRSYVSKLIVPGFDVESSNFQVDGDEVRWHSRLVSKAFDPEHPPTAQIDSQAVVRNGLIEMLKIHYSPESLESIRAALSQVREPA